jgi:hypothetical protein
MELAGSYMDTHIVFPFKLHEEPMQWRNKSYGSEFFCIPPERNAIDFETSCDVLICKTSR